MQRASDFANLDYLGFTCNRYIHVSLRNEAGDNIFAIPKGEGREGAAFEDTKYISETAEQFLAGVLDGIADSEPTSRTVNTVMLISS